MAATSAHLQAMDAMIRGMTTQLGLDASTFPATPQYPPPFQFQFAAPAPNFQVPPPEYEDDDEILDANLPKQFKLPHVGEYDGKGDPEEHLARFENAALLHKYSDQIKCRAFLTTLIGPAQRWFNTLRPGEIKEFKDFSKSFLHHFASSKKRPTTTFNLFAIKQHEHEDLRAYIRRFSALALEVPMATPDLLISAFMQGLDTKDFLKSLIKRPPETYEELLARAEKYVNMEEIQTSIATIKRKRPKIPKNHRVPNSNLGTGQSFRPSLLGEFTSFTPLRMRKTRALQICDDHKLTQRHPWTEKGPRNRESDKYCHFHNEYGHTTEDCCQLDQEIESIIQQHSELKNILIRQEGIARTRDNEEDHDREPGLLLPMKISIAQIRTSPGRTELIKDRLRLLEELST
ncbi:uncharacterized protein [Henckelia pumila]|uniref:uncharacterized protein n=1 Tax=Henckelia pumila TaxID=405737 RepID=UPI003C6E0B45